MNRHLCVVLLALASLPCACGGGGGSGTHPGTPMSIAAAGGDRQTGIVGAALTTPLTVKVTDASGAAVAGVAVSWAVAGGGGRTWTASGITDASGEASAVATLGLTAGTNIFTAAAAGLSGSPVTFTATGPAFSPSFSVTHLGTSDPAQEGFGIWPYLVGQSTEGPVVEDVGRDVWRITGLTASQQYAYSSAPLSGTEVAQLEADGFGLTVIARVQRGLAPAYTAGSPTMIGVVALSFDGQRFDVDLGIDGAGDTVVALPDSVGYTSGQIFQAPGAHLTLTGSGSSYHTYQLIYDPTPKTADLYVDGVARLHGYGGLSTYSADEGGSRGTYGVLPSGVSGGQVSYHLVQLASPAPSPVVP